ncbi:hypothetical protein ABT024_05035 [Streptomyces sp. NPDC002812]|uniref:hypothetical protein n=1 Tax=Streptomyces sp. NPDC002812 TaxID=3154434 RepID=UPI003331A5C4
MSAQPVEEQPQQLLWGSFNVFRYMPNVGGPAMRVLTYLLGTQEVGGRIVQTQQAVAEQLVMDRALCNKAFRTLELARMVRRESLGVYRLNPMLSGFRTPVEQMNAIHDMPVEDYLDVPNFQERFEDAVAADIEERKRKASTRKHRASVTDLTAARRSRAS